MAAPTENPIPSTPRGHHEGRRARVRALRALRQKRYRTLKADGRVVVEPKIDPVGLAEFLHAAGVMVLASDRKTLAAGIEALLAEWDEGRIRVTRIRDLM
jgi:hypothetical protein